MLPLFLLAGGAGSHAPDLLDGRDLGFLVDIRTHLATHGGHLLQDHLVAHGLVDERGKAVVLGRQPDVEALDAAVLVHLRVVLLGENDDGDLVVFSAGHPHRVSDDLPGLIAFIGIGEHRLPFPGVSEGRRREGNEGENRDKQNTQKLFHGLLLLVILHCCFGAPRNTLLLLQMVQIIILLSRAPQNSLSTVISLGLCWLYQEES